tara:strand:+ start:663 stop:1511 length:849 start_codon:yes stop_codon:yes gene_type:complete
MENTMNYFLKLDTIEILNDKRVLVTAGTNSFIVDESMVERAPDVTTNPNVWAKLDDIGRTTAALRRLLVEPMPSNITLEPVEQPVEQVAPGRNMTPKKKTPKMPLPNLEALGLKSGSDGPPPPFTVNEPNTEVMPMSDLGAQLGSLYENAPEQRRQIIDKVAGMIRLDMLTIKENLPGELRRAVVTQLMQRDSLNTPIIPPDLAAFIDDRPLSETLGSRQWDPGSDRATDTVGPNWAKSQEVLNKIANEVDESEFGHMYPTTQYASVEVNRKFSSSNTAGDE